MILTVGYEIEYPGIMPEVCYSNMYGISILSASLCLLGCKKYCLGILFLSIMIITVQKCNIRYSVHDKLHFCAKWKYDKILSCTCKTFSTLAQRQQDKFHPIGNTS